jgi:(heptosyl)LPS beta-1,4-glucosyltransferase
LNHFTASENNPNETLPKAMEAAVCIVTNCLDQKLEEIINACHPYFSEILIGYDGDVAMVSQDFNQKGKAKIILVTWQGFSTTKNELAARAKANWILSLDGDEVPDELLLSEIKKLPFATLPQNRIFSLKRISFFEDKKITHGAWGRDRVLRLYHKQYTQWDNAIVHENLVIKNDTEIVKPEGILYHYTADSYDTFLAKNKKYARLSAEQYFARKKSSPLWKRLLSPGFTFIKEYLFQGGFLDGAAGWKIAWVNALYTYWKYAFLREKYKG